MLLDDLLDTRGFAARHIGPDERDERAMLEFLGLASREALIAEALPAAIRQSAPLELPAPRTEPGALAELRAARRPQSGLAHLHRHGLLRHAHAAGDPAQRARESRLVHPLHALPGGNLAGTPGSAARLPANADRPHRTAGGKRLAARRGDRRRRGDGTDTARHEERAEGVLRGCGMPSAGDRGHPDPRPLARHPSRRRGCGYRARSGARLRRAPAVSRHPRPRRRPVGAHRPGACGRRHGIARRGPACARAAEIPRRARRGRRRRLGAALRGASRLRRPASRISRHPRAARAPDARAHRRRHA